MQRTASISHLALKWEAEVENLISFLLSFLWSPSSLKYGWEEDKAFLSLVSKPRLPLSCQKHGIYTYSSLNAKSPICSLLTKAHNLL